jgi:hypothetical protein
VCDALRIDIDVIVFPARPQAVVEPQGRPAPVDGRGSDAGRDAVPRSFCRELAARLFDEACTGPEAARRMALLGRDRVEERFDRRARERVDRVVGRATSRFFPSRGGLPGFENLFCAGWDTLRDG